MESSQAADYHMAEQLPQRQVVRCGVANPLSRADGSGPSSSEVFALRKPQSPTGARGGAGDRLGAALPRIWTGPGNGSEIASAYPGCGPSAAFPAGQDLSPHAALPPSRSAKGRRRATAAVLFSEVVLEDAPLSAPPARGGGDVPAADLFLESVEATGCPGCEVELYGPVDGVQADKTFAGRQGALRATPDRHGVPCLENCYRRTSENAYQWRRADRMLASRESASPGSCSAESSSPRPKYVYTAPCERRLAENEPSYAVIDKLGKCQNDVSRITFGVRIADFLPLAFKTVTNPTLFRTELAVLRHIDKCRRTATCPHIIHLTDHFTDDNGDPILVFRKHEKLSWEGLDLIDIACHARELMLALRAIHSVGIAHLDVNPANLMKDKKGRLVLIDFGLARECVPEDQRGRKSAAVDASPNLIGMGVTCAECNDAAAPPTALSSGIGSQSFANLDTLASEEVRCASVAFGRTDRRRTASPAANRVLHSRGKSPVGSKRTADSSDAAAARLTRNAPLASKPPQSPPARPGLPQAAASMFVEEKLGKWHAHRLTPHPLRGTPGYIAPELYSADSYLQSPPGGDGDGVLRSPSGSAQVTPFRPQQPVPTGAPDVYSAGVVIGGAAALFIPDCDLHLLGGRMCGKEVTNGVVRKLDAFARDALSKQRWPPVVVMLAEMLRRMLEEDPAARMTALEALRSPFVMALEEGRPPSSQSPAAAETSRVARHFDGTDRASFEKRQREWEWTMLASQTDLHGDDHSFHYPRRRRSSLGYDPGMFSFAYGVHGQGDIHRPYEDYDRDHLRCK